MKIIFGRKQRIGETLEQTQTRILIAQIAHGDAATARGIANLHGISWDQFLEDHSKEIVIAKLSPRCYNKCQEKNANLIRL